LLQIDTRLAVAANAGARRSRRSRRLATAMSANLASVEVGLMALLVPSRKPASVARMVLAVAVVYAGSEALGRLVPRARPFEMEATAVEPLAAHTPGRSFPSRHVASGLAMAMVGRRSHPLLGLVMGLVAALLGLSRVAAGLHYPSDVLAGAALGLGVGALLRPARQE
jgi:undecaprenyl-diphosphatase